MRKQTFILLIFTIVLALITFILFFFFVLNREDNRESGITTPTITPFKSTQQEKTRREVIEEWRGF